MPSSAAARARLFPCFLKALSRCAISVVFRAVLSVPATGDGARSVKPSGGRSVGLGRAGPFAEITVRDNGEGIDPEFLPYVFDRFRQADSSITRRHGGLGIGLSIVRQLVEVHRGSVAATSRGPGEGATFTIKLPVLPDTYKLHVEVAATGVNDAYALEGVHVLVVDDDRDTREMIRVALDLQAASVRTAGNAREALNILEQWVPEVLICDIGMPDEDGYSLMRKVRMGEKGIAIRAVALTGYAGVTDAELALQAGYQVHLAKPITPENLVETVAMLVHQNEQS